MKTAIATIEASNFDEAVKTELKAFVASFKDAKDRQSSGLTAMHGYKAGTNERQYARRIAEKMTTEKRTEMQINQFAYRNAFANSVFRVYQARKKLVQMGAEARELVAKLESGAFDPCNRNALLTIMSIAYETDTINVDAVLSELDNVSDISRDRILEAVQTIFEQKKAQSGMMADISFSSMELLLIDSTPELQAVNEAVLLAIAIRQEFEDFWSAYNFSKSRFNVPQFTQRMEQAFAEGDEAKVESIRSSRLDAECAVFVTASNWVNAYPRLVKIRENLKAAIHRAADAITETKSLDAAIVMSHLIGCWHWHSELNKYIEGKYRKADLDNVIAGLDFDVQAYLRG